MTVVADRTDFDNAQRGLVARLEPGVVTAADGRVVFDIEESAVSTSRTTNPTPASPSSPRDPDRVGHRNKTGTRERRTERG